MASVSILVKKTHLFITIQIVFNNLLAAYVPFPFHCMLRIHQTHVPQGFMAADHQSDTSSKTAERKSDLREQISVDIF